MVKIFVALLATGLVFGVACKKEETSPAATVDSPAAATENVAKDEPAPAASGDSIGVPECDEYLTKMSECMSKMPEAAKAASEQGLKATKEAWAKAAKTPAGKEGLKTACKAVLDALASNPMCK